MTEVVDFTGKTRLEISPDRLLDSKTSKNAKSMLILSVDEDERLFMQCTTGNIADQLLMLRAAEHFVLNSYLEAQVAE
jgi:hypothetical protein